MVRTAIWQGGKWRCIDDGRRSLLNNATLLVETIATPTFELPLWIARAMHREALSIGVPMPAVMYGLDDLLAAFRTLPTSEQQFNLFVTWNPHTLPPRLEYHYTYGFVFGLKASVTQFNRFPEVMTAVARKLGVPAGHFFDDYQIVDVAAGGDSGQRLVFEIHRQVGDGLRSDVARRSISAPAIELLKRKPMAPSNIGLGVEVDLSAVHTRGVVIFKPSASRVEHILSIWDKAQKTDRLDSGTAASLRGKRSFLLQATHGRVGRAASLSLVQREFHDGDVVSYTESLQHAHEFDVALLPILPPREVAVKPPSLRPLLIYTDAMFRPRKRKLRGLDDSCTDRWKASFLSRIGVVLYDPHCDPSSGVYAPHSVVGCDGGFLLYGAAVPPDETIATFGLDRNGDFQKTYIAQLEVVGGVAAYFTFAERVKGRDVNHFIDNTVALSGLVHGYARKLDLARMVNAFHLQMAGLRANAYYEFVPSLANIADLPSRNEFELLEQLGGRRVDIVFPPAADWLGPLRRAGATQEPCATLLAAGRLEDAPGYRACHAGHRQRAAHQEQRRRRGEE